MPDESKPDPSEHKEFIYGPPWVTSPPPAPLVNTGCPRNVQLRGIFKRSFAYHTLSERVPVILTKVIDQLSKSGDTKAVQEISKLKSELVTNKKIEPFKEGSSEDADYWNECIKSEDDPSYFTAIWVFSECYIYRRLKECFGGKDTDPFQTQKQEAFTQNLEASSLTTRKLNELVNSDSNKDSLAMLLKLSLWANKCDLSLTGGEKSEEIIDPVEMVNKLKANILTDDAAKVADYIIGKSGELQKKIDETNWDNLRCSCNRLAAAKGLPNFEPTEEEKKAAEESAAEGAAPEEPKEVIPPEKRNPCPSKIAYPSRVTVDIICDNAGYELVTDLCIGHFLLAKGIVKRVRYHVKAIPWFVSDVTPKDFKWVVDQCASSNFVKEIPLKEGEEPPESTYQGDGSALDKDPERYVTSLHLQTLGKECKQYLEDGLMTVESDTFWTSPTLYKDMKRLNPVMYRKLQLSFALIFKGDLNYRKLIGEKNWPPTTGFTEALQGFNPAPLVAIRTIKSDLVAGLPKNKWETLTKLDEQWMEKGEYGIIQFCPKKEDPKAIVDPCPEFGDVCKGKCA